MQLADPTSFSMRTTHLSALLAPAPISSSPRSNRAVVKLKLPPLVPFAAGTRHPLSHPLFWPVRTTGSPSPSLSPHNKIWWMATPSGHTPAGSPPWMSGGATTTQPRMFSTFGSRFNDWDYNLWRGMLLGRPWTDVFPLDPRTVDQVQKVSFRKIFLQYITIPHHFADRPSNFPKPTRSSSPFANFALRPLDFEFYLQINLSPLFLHLYPSIFFKSEIQFIRVLAIFQRSP
jgi:hypothetical protein